MSIKIHGKKNVSYYNFLHGIEEENLPVFTEAQVKFANYLSAMLPLIRKHEYLIFDCWGPRGMINGFCEACGEEVVAHQFNKLYNEEISIRDRVTGFISEFKQENMIGELNSFFIKIIKPIRIHVQYQFISPQNILINIILKSLDLSGDFDSIKRQFDNIVKEIEDAEKTDKLFKKEKDDYH